MTRKLSFLTAGLVLAATAFSFSASSGAPKSNFVQAAASSIVSSASAAETPRVYCYNGVRDDRSNVYNGSRADQDNLYRGWICVPAHDSAATH